MGLLGEIKPVKKPILGVSLYPEQESMEEIENYLTMASRYGFTKIFTSMFSVPGTKEEVFDYFKNFCDLAHKHGMKVSGDCNTAFLKKWELVRVISQSLKRWELISFVWTFHILIKEM